MSTPPKKSEEQLHYESLTSFFMKGVGFVGAFITVVASVAIYCTYSDRQSMKDDYDKLKQEFKNQMTDVRTDAKESLKNIKEESRYELQLAKENSQNELAILRTETHTIALDEAKKQIDDIFKSDKIQSIIEKNAIGELKDKLPATIADYTKNYPEILEAHQWMKNGVPEGIPILKSYFNSESAFEREISKKYYQDDCNTYYKQFANFTPEQIAATLKGYNLTLSDFHKITDNKYPTKKEDIDNLEVLMKMINDKDNRYMLFGKALALHILSNISNKQFLPFQIDEVNSWYNGLKR